MLAIPPSRSSLLAEEETIPVNVAGAILLGSATIALALWFFVRQPLGSIYDMLRAASVDRREEAEWLRDRLEAIEEELKRR